MVGVKGRSGGYRPGAGRRPGATAIKKKAKGATRNKKKKAADPEPTNVKCEPKRSQWVQKDAPGLPLSPQMYPGGCHERGTRR